MESLMTGMFLMTLEMVSGYSKFPWEVLLKVSSRSNIRNLVKIAPILQVSYWSLGGQGCSWWSWRWCQGTQNTLGKFAVSFIKIYYQEPSQDSKCQLSIFLESRRTEELPDGIGDGVLYSAWVDGSNDALNLLVVLSSRLDKHGLVIIITLASILIINSIVFFCQ